MAAVWALFPASAARAHGSEEIEIFRYLLEEPGFLRLTAALLGAMVFLLGGYIALQGRREWRRLRETSDESPLSSLRLVMPGAIFAAVGAGILLAAAFVLPDRIKLDAHDHPVHQEQGEESGKKGSGSAPARGADGS